MRNLVRGSDLRRSRSSSSSSSGLCARKRFDLDSVFYFAGPMVVVGDWVIGSLVVLPRGGSRVSSSIVSFGERSNHCILVIIIFLGSCLAFHFVSLGAFGLLCDKF